MKNLSKKISEAFKPESSKSGYYLVYTLLFFCVVFLCFSYFIFSDRSFIWNVDGWDQHFKALVYYAKYLRSIFRHLLFDHKIIIPDWEFTLGEGADIVNALHYYVIGDPITLLSVFVPTKYMQYFYSFSCILKLYLSGLMFSFLCFGTGKKNRYAIMAGTMSYALCNWGILNAARHPNFLSPLIYFPMMILGIEKIIKKEKPYVFIASAALSAACNFYFFYMIVILAVGYALVRLIILYKSDVMKGIMVFARLGLMAVIGVSISGVILLPVLMFFLHDARLVSASQPFHLFYPLSYYSMLPSVLIGDKTPYWLTIGLSAPVWLATGNMLLQKKSNGLFKTLLFICGLIIVFPIGGRILNGMSYMTNRWSWALILLCSYILVSEWDQIMAIEKKNWILLLLGCCIFYLIVLHFDKSRGFSAFSMIAMLFITLLIIQKTDKKMVVTKQIMILLMVIFNSVSIAFWKYAPSAGNYIADCVENKKIWNVIWPDNEAAVVKKIADDSFVRYSRRNLANDYSGAVLSYNTHFVNNISNTAYYFTNSSPSMNEFRNDMQMREDLFQQYEGYDDRTALIALSSVNYYLTPENDNSVIPYGYLYIGTESTLSSQKKKYAKKLKKELGIEKLTAEQKEKLESAISHKYDIYKNQYALPYGYFYDQYVDLNTWNKMDPIQKQEAQLSAALVEEGIYDLEMYSAAETDYTIPYEMECLSPEISVIGNKLISTEENAQIIIRFKNPIKDSEIYFGIEGLQFTATPEYDLYFKDSEVDPLNLYNKVNWNLLPKADQISIKKEKDYWGSAVNTTITIQAPMGVRKSISYRQPDSDFSSSRHDFVANMGYSSEAADYVMITLSERGVYSFDDLNVYAVSMDGYSEKIKNLQMDSLTDLSFGIDSINGNVSLSDNKILCLATPYSEGWKVLVDGEESSVLQVNKRYMGVYLSSGNHQIQFLYSMPYKREGFYISCMGFLAGFLVIIFTEKRKKNREKS